LLFICCGHKILTRNGEVVERGVVGKGAEWSTQHSTRPNNVQGLIPATNHEKGELRNYCEPPMVPPFSMEDKIAASCPPRSVNKSPIINVMNSLLYEMDKKQIML